MLKKTLVAAMFASSLLTLPAATLAMGGSSGPHQTYKVFGKLGAVVMNPYKIAPLTAVIKNGGYTVRDVTVRIVPKEGGAELSYPVADTRVLQYGGIPIFGLYPDYYNTVEVSYTRIQGQKSERVEKEVYKFKTPGLYGMGKGAPDKEFFFKADVKKMDPAFKDRLYLVNNLAQQPSGAMHVWNNPSGGALEWDFITQNVIIDSAGDIRWYLLNEGIQDPDSIYRAGIMMGFKQNPDGAFSWGFGQTWVKYDLMGRKIFDRRLPDSYNDFSHFLDVSPNGHYFARVASNNYKRPDGKNVRTVRDVIVEMDQNGDVVDEWRLFEILDPYRDVNIKALDQGAVCLNIDASKAGQTMSTEDLTMLDKEDKFGDIAGTGAGRNWVHVNSVDHDPVDDSIIISSRHQSAVVKIGRDKEVKWILSSPEGWRDPWKQKLLTPIDKNGKKINYPGTGSKCEGDFDWTWTQHTAFKVDELSDDRYLILSVFDNGDSRGMEQPVFPDDKYSRAVVYKIDQKNRTVEQIWEYGKERGHEWFSPVTSLVQYQADKKSLMVYSATAGVEFDKQTKKMRGAPNPFINEFKWGEKEPAVEIRLKDTMGYQAMPVSAVKAFGPRK